MMSFDFAPEFTVSHPSRASRHIRIRFAFFHRRVTTKVRHQCVTPAHPRRNRTPSTRAYAETFSSPGAQPGHIWCESVRNNFHPKPNHTKWKRQSSSGGQLRIIQNGCTLRRVVMVTVLQMNHNQSPRVVPRVCLKARGANRRDVGLARIGTVVFLLPGPPLANIQPSTGRGGNINMGLWAQSSGSWLNN